MNKTKAASSLTLQQCLRRDVSKLEEQGLLVSVSGGVRAVSRLAAEPSHLVKSTLQSEENRRSRAGGESYR
ncbi:hypothetical protein [Klebsiella pneumoniae]|uniref:hypothetical protein n=1 Tax=Klebsiella pneumoniae TaxID=573 RepID=UPI00161462AC|nr:hypothetical protein [Klebsiella pneumoniae]